MSEGISRGEFSAFCERLYETQDAGFQGIHERLDVLNGRTGKGEVERENLRVRVTSLEKEVFSPKRRQGDTDGVRQIAGLTKRESTLLGLGLLVIAAALKLLLATGTFTYEMLKVFVGKHP